MTECLRGQSRRTLLQAGLTVAAGGAAARATAQQKLAKELIMYQDQPKDGQQCSNCQHWQPPNACAIVAGEISPNGWCGAFAPKG
ncbi:MAG TPA: high-potential iron-sulfur protein [Crenalkalicoccus sp.]|jgi:hypothetical protein|nr:high-potential iron-sulfur protein [Crenalkalicoccus sp.]